MNFFLLLIVKKKNLTTEKGKIHVECLVLTSGTKIILKPELMYILKSINNTFPLVTV